MNKKSFKIASFVIVTSLVATLSFAQHSMNSPQAQNGDKSSPPDLNGIWQSRKFADVINFSPEFAKTGPPLTAEAKAKYKSADMKDLPMAHCLPPGLPLMMNMPQPMDILQQSHSIVIWQEEGPFIRQIFTDGRSHSQKPDPTWLGESIGHWEGNTLVVDTIGFNGKGRLDQSGLPQSDALHIVERIQRDGAVLQNDMTIDDPQNYTQPWSVHYIYDLKPTWDMMEYVCEENNKY